MKLYILRHGQSPSTSQANVNSDAERPLSPRGRADIKKMAELLLSRGGRPTLILHSPLRRAVETAQEAAAVLKPAPVLERFLPLSNTMGGAELLAHLRKRLEPPAEALIIGHQPQLGELAAVLAKNIFTISPGGLIALDAAQEETARILWSCNPEELP